MNLPRIAKAAVLEGLSEALLEVISKAEAAVYLEQELLGQDLVELRGIETQLRAIRGQVEGLLTAAEVAVEASE